MKKLKYYSFTFLLALSLLASTFLLDTKTASAEPYDGSNPYSTGCAYNQALTYETKYIYNGNGNAIGYVQLRGSAGCHTAWAYIKLYNPAPKNDYANAYVVRYPNYKLVLSCNNSGGNGNVDYGQTSCYTPQIYDANPYAARAEGYVNGATYQAITNYH